MDAHSADQLASYNRQVEQQLNQYKNADEIHEKPSASAYWIFKAIEPRALVETGTIRPADFYSKWIQTAIKRTGFRTIYSVGSGDGTVERRVAQTLKDCGLEDFHIICLELSPNLIAQGQERTLAAGLQDVVVFEQVDLNRSLPFQIPPAAIMANQCLHHFVELEPLFARIKEAIGPNGLFLTCDMIGRNGHMRWPEVESLMRDFWDQMPEHARFDHQHQEPRRDFENWDCSIEGFEGVRAQDILALLTHSFYFHSCFTFGGLVEVFVDRGLGPNFDLANKDDTDFLDRLIASEARLHASGRLCPTAIWAALGNTPPDVACVPSPASFVRDPLALIDPITLEEAGLVGQPKVVRDVPTIGVGETLDFGDLKSGDALRWGWLTQGDTSFWWGWGTSSAIKVNCTAAPGAALTLNIHSAGYVASQIGAQNVALFVNGVEVATWQHSHSAQFGWHTCELPAGIRQHDPNGDLLIEFKVDRSRRPEIDEGPDLRPLSLALAAIRFDVAP